MKNELISTLATDLKINKFSDESEIEYNQRLIYSAAAAWAKTLVYGHSYSDHALENDFVNTDIMYIQIHLSKVLEAYLQCFKINRDWIEKESDLGIKESASTLASHIIREVLYTYGLAEIFSRRITTIRTSFYKYDKDLYLIRGNAVNATNVYSVGVSQWKRDGYVENHLVNKKIIDVSGKDYYGVMEKEFDWKESNLTGGYLIFKLGSKGRYSSCWRPISLYEIPIGISILRLDDKYNGGYILVKKKEDKLLITELDPWYIEEKEIYRILYALNYYNGTPAQFIVQIREDFIILKCSSALPKYEDRILTCCSWPYINITNKYLRVVPKFLWETVEKLLTELGIKLVELGEGAYI